MSAIVNKRLILWFVSTLLLTVVSQHSSAQGILDNSVLSNVIITDDITEANLQFDAFASGTGTTTISWTHTPVGTPRGIVVFILNNNDNDQISGCTYGTGGGQIALTQIGNAADNAGEPGFVEAYFSGSSIPTGAQTVECTITAGSNSKHGISLSFTSNSNVSITGTYCTVTGDVANPSCTVTGTSGTVIGLAATHRGENTIDDVGAGAGYTIISENDYGLQVTSSIRLTTPAAGNPTLAFSTAGANDTAMIGIAIK